MTIGRKIFDTKGLVLTLFDRTELKQNAELMKVGLGEKALGAARNRCYAMNYNEALKFSLKLASNGFCQGRETIEL